MTDRARDVNRKFYKNQLLLSLPPPLSPPLKPASNEAMPASSPPSAPAITVKDDIVVGLNDPELKELGGDAGSIAKAIAAKGSLPAGLVQQREWAVQLRQGRAVSGGHVRECESTTRRGGLTQSRRRTP